jgi:copper transport protein
MRLLAALVFVLAVLTGCEAGAHAVLVETSPADRAVLSAPPAAIVLTFSETIEPVAVRLIDGKGAAVTSASAAAGATLRLTPAAPLARGTYIVSWRVISADAHPVAGAFQFAVGAAPPTWAASLLAKPAADWTKVAAANRAVHLIALLIAIGGALYAFAVAAHPRRTRLWAALVAAATAVVGVGIEGALVLDLPVAGLFDPETWRYGATTTRGVAAAVAVIGVAGIALGARVLGAAVALASFALSGHAATAPPQAVAVPVLLVHTAIAAFWVGSFLPLRRAARGDVARFSAIAVWLVPVLVAAGLVMALLQVPRWSALVTSGYGIALLVKLTFVGALLLVAAFNRFVLMPRLPGSMPRLRASIAVELALAMAILGATAVLSQLTPPRSIAPPGAASRSFSVAAEKPSAIVVSGNLVATIEVTPGRPGSNIVAVGFADRAGKTVTPQEATLYLSNAAAGIEELERRMARNADGLWRQGGPELAVAGTWTIRVDALVTDFDKVVFTTSLAIR